MSHEIRTPLNAIIGFGEILSMEGNRPEEIQEYVKIIQKNSDLLWKLVSDVLDISELESGSFQADFIPCDVVQLSSKISKAETEKKSTNARFIFDSSLNSYWLETDIKLLKKLLTILLINAAKFTSSGEIILKLRPAAKDFIFSVTDSGCGIPQNKHGIIFERFEKLDPFTQGTGLGLPLCKWIADTLGGRIYIDPNYQKGARFVFHHPLSSPAPAENETDFPTFLSAGKTTPN